MGDIPDDVVSKRSLYYYNTDGLFVGRADYGRLYTDEGYSDDFDVMTFCKAVFNTDGMMTNKDTYQWGEYDGGDFIFSAELRELYLRQRRTIGYRHYVDVHQRVCVQHRRNAG